MDYSKRSHSITLLPMRQLAEATRSEDDWTGVTDSKERKRRQNRLNQRALRRRNKVDGGGLVAGNQSCPLFDTAEYFEHDATSYMSETFPPSTSSYEAVANATATALSSLNQVAREGSEKDLYFPLTPDHILLYVVALNLCRAVLTNYSILSTLQFEGAPKGCFCVPRIFPLSLALSPDPFSQSHAEPFNNFCIPLAFTPTPVQQQIPHYGWIDLIPSPRLRDNLILAVLEQRVNLDELSYDLVGGLFSALQCTTEDVNSKDGCCSEADTNPNYMPRLPPKEHPWSVEDMCRDVTVTISQGAPVPTWEEFGFIAWSDPWDVSGWEVNSKFIAKWAFLFQGCSDMIDATNQWRAIRGEEPINIEF